jgi:hypothetical protein
MWVNAPPSVPTLWWTVSDATNDLPCGPRTTLGAKDFGLVRWRTGAPDGTGRLLPCDGTFSRRAVVTRSGCTPHATQKADGTIT